MAKDITLLWGSGSPPCWRIMIALEEKNLQGYNQKLLSFEKGEHKSKEVMDINPRGQTHYTTDVKNESFLLFFSPQQSKYKSQGTKLIPDCDAEQALMFQRVFEVNTFGDKMGMLVRRCRICLSFVLPVCTPNSAAKSLSTSGGFLAGKNFSLADVIVFPAIAYLYRFGLSEERYPKLTEYYKNLMNRPSIKATWPPTWKETPGQDILKDI
uniref:Glutathione S-transferase A-like n=1 Tax=Pundamilia nyererei TaxID=303518 RepID=A0A3B4ETT9_9CICH